ncbi:related to Putative channel protein, exgression is glucose repressed by Mig1 and Mig2 [Phialocephala subalpina]|uniref:Related to Putative channel protein, exgression is glucose repressed by Mig1 and Mig2 n=1 Tax=Phialocephala subalpina TaxID=576137 RepID=A0A1L7XCZ7_9HELO|nr:related to Putative channel protein, exgression is glucose repressed by Mig1 and Mig2 [Phialocephala subalpina]
MADEQKDTRQSVEGTGAGNGGEAAPAAGSNQTSTNREERSVTPSARAVEAEGMGAQPLHRAGTLPPRHQVGGVENNTSDFNRRRGRTISSRPAQGLDAPYPLSPRSQIFKRAPADRDGSRDAVPEGRQPSGSRPRGSTNSERPPFTSPGMRPRMSTWNVGGSPGPAFSRQRGSTLQRRPTILIEPPGGAMATGRDFDAQSANFTLAGQAIGTVAANQPYVDPGYADLNPAYDQPVNSRPVWGLAKPLPRVIRPGMVPTRSELKLQIPDEEQQRQDGANVDLEQGRVQATINPSKISPQLQQARQQRENRMLQRVGTGLSPASPSNQRPPSLFSPTSQAIEEEEEQDVAEGKHSDLPNIPEQPTPGPTRPGSPVQQAQGQTHDEWLPDDASSIMTAKEQDDALDGDWIGEEFPLKAYDPETDEIHNLHTHWSVIRLRFREPLAELLAVTVQLTLGFCADLVVSTSNSKAGNEETTDWAWGLATMVGIYIAGGISGAHLNPAISIMLYIFRGFPLRKVPIYIAAQILGAFLAGLIAFGLYQKDIIAFGGSDLANSGTLSAFITYPRYDWIDASTAFFTEFTGTAILAVAVLALGDDTNALLVRENAFVLGLIVTVLSMAFGYNTGAAMNPARDLGPRLACLAVGYGSQIFTNGYWIYGPWVGTITGAIFGALLYDVAIFVGGESPVNYPRKRMVRAGKKWKRRWAGRLQRGRYRVLRRGRPEEEDGVGVGRSVKVMG